MKTASSFVAITSEGGLLPADFLAELLAPKSAIEGLEPTTYSLAEGERINEQVNRSWNRLKGRWADFRKVIADKQPGESTTTETRDRWLQPIFQELGFGQRLPLVPAIEVDGRSYSVSHGWNHVPIHLVGSHVDLDRRTPGTTGATKASPHSLVQQVLNACEGRLWGVVSNGLTFRLLRDNVALTRLSFVEWDLAAIFDGDLYSEFFLLWLVAHQSRFDAERPEQCWLEKWRKLAEDKGLRALEQLRPGVARAIEALGAGLVSHPANQQLRAKLSRGELTTQHFYRQVLRVVYRLLFLFVAEDRDLLHPPLAKDDPTGEAAALKARNRYRDFYSVTRLRNLTLHRAGTPHPDLWHVFQLLTKKLGSGDGCPALALPALGSFLWDGGRSTPDLTDALVSNRQFLTAVHALAFVQDGSVRRPIDYKNLGSEELGSVYEGLLELHPRINADTGQFELNMAAGNERKTTGSYYTPDSLVQCLLDSALEPVVEEAVRGKEGPAAAEAILKLKVCDPAVGSGHFLIAAAHRLAKRLAATRTGEGEPSPVATRSALRDVIGHCLFGVDINPMSAELCRVSLWLESLEPGKPLSFLDHHIQVGNSLLGTTPALLAKGLPDDSFTAIEGDVKTRVTQLKKQNKREREEYKSGQGYLFEPHFKLGNLTAEFARLNAAPDGTVAEVSALSEQYARLIRSSEYESTRLLADTWCATFVWKKDDSDLGKLCPTERDFRKVESNAAAGLLPHVRAEVERLRDKYQFFHWHLAFPDVFRLPGKDERLENEQTGWSGGFDIVLGNPPWEMFEVKDDEFFAESNPAILAVGSAKDKANLIKQLNTDAPETAARYAEYVRDVAAENHLISVSGRYPLASQGRINLYRLFVETAQYTISPQGRFGLIIPSGFASDSFAAPHFRFLCETEMLHSLFDFENRERTLFPGVYYRTRFCLLTVKQQGARQEPKEFDFVFLATNVAELSDPNRHVTMTSHHLALINPITKTAPFITSSRDFELIALAHARGTPFALSSDSKWNISTMLMFMMNASMKDNKSLRDCESMGLTLKGNIFSNKESIYLPLYEGKMIGMYSHRASSIRFDPGKRVRKSQAVVHTDEDLHNPTLLAMPLFWVSQDIVEARCARHTSRWFVVVKDITSTTNERSVIGAIGPLAAYTHSVPCIFVEGECARMIACLLANLNSLPVDYVAKQKLSGLHLYGSVLNQLPILPRATFLETCSWDVDVLVRDWIASRVLELSYTADDIESFARDIGYVGAPFLWQSERRFELQRQLDAAFFHLYGFDRSMVSDILDRFRIIRDREIKTGGVFYTKHRTLELYDDMSQTIGTCDVLR